MRHDMPWQGYAKEIAPNLTKLADKSAVYTRAYSISSFTSKSVGAILSGQYPSTLYRGPAFFTKYSNANLFFPEVLQHAGVRTMAGQAHGYFERGNNVRQGFDVWNLVPNLKWDAEKDVSVTSQDMTPMAIDMLKDATKTDGAFFMWLHYMDPHHEYRIHKECPDFGHRAREMYDNEICYTDLWIKKLLDYCEAQSWWKDTVLVVTADHGEAFGEHGMWNHAFALWEVLTHVPMMISGPGIQPRRIEERRSHIDLAPTIVDLLGVTAPTTFVGKSMVPELLGAEAPGNREPILLDLPADSYNPRTRVTIQGDYKLIEDPNDKFQLYNLNDDPDEKKNLAPVAAMKEKLAEMKATHEKAWAKYPYVAPWGGRKLAGGLKADGPFGPDGIKDADQEPGVP
jgi:arylsulfatase A-like enzyme